METYNLKMADGTLKAITDLAQTEGRKVTDMARILVETGLKEYRKQKDKLDKLKEQEGITI